METSKAFFKSALRHFRERSGLDRVLVIGAAHIDVIADHPGTERDRLDKVGTVRYAIGGTAFNIAVNLGQQSIPVSLLTVLRRNRFSSTWIETRLADAGVDGKLIEFSDRIEESGFIAIRENGELTTAVTGTGIDSHLFNAAQMEVALSGCRLVVVDCNLSARQLQHIFEVARKHNKPLVVAAVSDSKVRRIQQLSSEAQATLVFLNENELRVVAGADALQAHAPGEIRAIAAQLHTETLVVTRGANGYSVLTTAPPLRTDFPAPSVERIASTSGAGDAVIAGMVQHWYKTKQLSFERAARDVALIVSDVLGEEGSTINALAAEVDFVQLARVAVRKQSLMQRFLSQEVGVLVGIVALVLTMMQTKACALAGPDPEVSPKQEEGASVSSLPRASACCRGLSDTQLCEQGGALRTRISYLRGLRSERARC